MSIISIPLESYSRLEHFQYYLDHEMTLQTTVNVDMTKIVRTIKKYNLRTLPVVVWIISMAVNQVEPFRTTVGENGNPCMHDVLHPGYVVLNKETNTFSCICTSFSSDFKEFYNRCIEDMQLSETAKLFPISDEPTNIFSITTIPFLPFESFYIGLRKPSRSPILATGKYFKKKGRTWMPISVQVHHAFCDALHISIFFETIKKIIDGFRV